MGAGTKANTLGGGALEIGDLRLVEDGGECSGALVSNGIATETASERAEPGAKRETCQRALTKKQTLWGWRRTSGR